MSIIVSEFHKDLDRLERLANLSKTGSAFAALNPPAYAVRDEFLTAAETMHQESRNCRSDLVILPGTLLLYLAGRFEDFIRTIFEDLCDRLVNRCNRFADLPKDLRDNAVIYTAEVISSYRKYGHGEGAVSSFVECLASNLSDAQPLTKINSQCLSITTENMRADVLADLFKRIGVKTLWDKIGEQAPVQTHFETIDRSDASSRAQKYLNEFMRSRNYIAHPSANITWPDMPKLIDSISFFRMLSSAISLVLDAYEVTLVKK
jgi:RiboL-PSP-HEPN